MAATPDIFHAPLPVLQDWGRGIMASRPPDYTVGEDYLRRWWVVPRNDFANVYLHLFRASDEDRALHDHPWASTSVILQGSYIEHTPDGQFLRREGSVTSRPAEALHRVELIDAAPVMTLFMTGPKVRAWGFACPQGWRHWREFTDPDNSGQVGRGCD